MAVCQQAPDMILWTGNFWFVNSVGSQISSILAVVTTTVMQEYLHLWCWWQIQKHIGYLSTPRSTCTSIQSGGAHLDIFILMSLKLPIDGSRFEVEQVHYSNLARKGLCRDIQLLLISLNKWWLLVIKLVSFLACNILTVKIFKGEFIWHS